ncbi:hypothetical protein V8E54_012404 [Elaphomyces granulatus]
MSQPSTSTCTFASSPVHVAVDDPDPGDTGNDDVVREENRGQEKSDDDDDDSTSPSNKEQSDDASIATALITELIDLCIRTARDHLQEHTPQGHERNDNFNQNHAPALDTHDDIQYLNGFPALTHTILDSIRTGESYFQGKERPVNSMMSSRNTPQDFITLTFNDTWDEFKHILRNAPSRFP